MRQGRGRGWGWAAGATVVALAACGSRYDARFTGGPGGAGASGPASPAVCTSGSLWSANLQEGADMAPGRACVACHAEENAASGELDAPMFAVAGTLYPTLNEPDDCRAPAAQGAIVRVTSLSGLVREAIANEVGNFFLDEEDGVVPPFTVEVVQSSRRRRMVTPAPSGDCSTCHAAVGLSGAPGRVLLP